VRKKKRQDKSQIDIVSAVIILQNYLELKSNFPK
jgi:RNase H-fold protein (predicted Holliday junction resolvase)